MLVEQRGNRNNLELRQAHVWQPGQMYLHLPGLAVDFGLGKEGPWLVEHNFM